MKISMSGTRLGCSSVVFPVSEPCSTGEKFQVFKQPISGGAPPVTIATGTATNGVAYSKTDITLGRGRWKVWVHGTFTGNASKKMPIAVVVVIEGGTLGHRIQHAEPD